MLKILNRVQFQLLQCTTTEQIQIRNVWILKRRWPVHLSKTGAIPRKLKAKDFTYEVVENTELNKKEDMQLLLVKYVEGLGQPGDIVQMKPQSAYEKLLLPGKAVYATQENLTQFTGLVQKSQFSSKHSQRTQEVLSHRVVPILVNKDHPWVLEPWHIRVNMRKAGIVVPEDAITMPSNEIKGPDLELENKEFPVKITINNMETVHVRCRIHHWSTKLEGRLPHVDFHWLSPSQPLFCEDKELLDSLPHVYVKLKKPPTGKSK